MKKNEKIEMVAMKRIVIMGATSGIGRETARACLRAGWRVGAAGRRIEELEALKQEAPEQVEIEAIDITSEEAPEGLLRLIEKLGGADIYLHVSGIGFQNIDLTPEVELRTVATNAAGLTRMVGAAWHYFRQTGGGHIAAVSSIAGTKGLGVAPAYSATKGFQNLYLDALAQLSQMQRAGIRFTDIRPGFVQTALLSDGQRYPLMMRPERVAKRIFRALKREERVVVIDWRYALITLFWRLIPRWLWERLPIRTRKKQA